MKLKHFFVGSLFLIVVGASISSFNLASSHLANTGTCLLYARYELDNYAPGFQDLISSAASEMSPNVYTATFSPTIAYGGLSGIAGDIAPAQNSMSEVGFAYASNANSPASTYRFSAINGGHTEYDISINSNFVYLSDFGNGYNGTIDRATALKHEIGHGVGLSHTELDASYLMYATYTFDERKAIGTDEKRGIKCIYDGTDCEYNEQLCGNIEVTAKKVLQHFHSYLNWVLETEDKSIRGFNILKKSKKSKTYEFVNRTFIKPDNFKNEFVYTLPQEVYNLKGDRYYLEIIYINDKKILKEFKD